MTIRSEGISAWEAHAISNFCWRVVGVNWFHQAPEYFPGNPDIAIDYMDDLPCFIGVGAS